MAVFEQPSYCEQNSSIVPILLSIGFATTSAFSLSCMSGANVAVFLGAGAAGIVSAWNASVGAGGGAMVLADGAPCLAAGAVADVTVVDGTGSQ